jgi:AcrR family transcriptional regulator
MAAPATRAVRSDGIRSRDAILRTAASLATVRGLEALSLGDLAAEVGMSKSGMYAHFGSKEELQLATVAAAKTIFEEVVLEPASGYPAGRDGLIALADLFMEHIRDRVFPGGCFFDATVAELLAHPGPVLDAVMEVRHDFRQRFHDHLLVAAAEGELPDGVDLEQLEFDVMAGMSLGQDMFRARGDGRAIDLAERAVRLRLGLPADYQPVRSR